ncbi:MAG: hypothetical protein ACYCT1_03865 [Steroidobacteraceae bacterium]
MAERNWRVIASALLAAVLCGGPLVYGLGWGVPQWAGLFRGELDPAFAVYGGWAVSLGVVAVGIVLVGGWLALCWLRATVTYLPVGLGLLAIMVFVTLGMPAQIQGQIDAAVSLAIVALCALLVARVFAAAVRARLARRYRA